TLAGIEVDDLDEMDVSVEDFLFNTEKGKRDMRMDARVNIRKGEERANIEIQRVKKEDEAARALNYAGGLITDFPKGLKRIPQTRSTVIFICNYDPFEGTQYSGQTRMRFTLRSNDDETKIHTLHDKPYPFDGLTIIIYNGAQDWEKNPPKSEEEARIKVYLEDMKNTDPGKMTSDIARTACRNYKEDPKAVDDVKDWIIYKYGKQMKEELAIKEKALAIELEKKLEKKIEKKYEKKLNEELEKKLNEELEKKLNEEVEKKLGEQKKESEEAIERQRIQIAKKLLSSSSLTISEIAAVTNLDESEVKKISDEL
ncbi:MAG: hypothetical protein SPF69_08065, partial [Candidatus Ornithospirochaeta sp.]|nr:hypothetical protein [Sphaerochaetaceae bacterium]MDY5524024.1 hypothetical protein [Candidatus Ornithospirochaeta sp.]